MKYAVERQIKGFLSFLIFAFFSTVMSILSVMPIKSFNANAACALLLSGAFGGLLIYFSGMAMSMQLLRSEDDMLIPLVPVTSAMLHWRRLKSNFGFLIPFVSLLAALPFLLRDVARSASGALVWWNISLTVSAIFFYPILIKTVPAFRHWEGFFFWFRKLVWQFLRLLVLPPGFWKLPAWAAAVWAAWFFSQEVHRLAEVFAGQLARLLATSAIARAIYFLCVPFAGIPYLHAPFAERWEASGLTVFLAGLNLAILFAYLHRFRRPMNSIDRARTDEWLEIREEFESIMEEEAELRSIPGRQIEEHSFAAAAIDQAIGSAEAENREPRSVDAEANTISSQDEIPSGAAAIEYEPELESWEQISRHMQHWIGAAAKPEISPQKWGLIFILSGSVVAAATVSMTANNIVLVATALIGVGAPLVFAFRCAGRVQSIRSSAHFAALDWKPLTRKMAVATSRKWLAIEIAAAAWISFAIGGRVWGWVPVWFMFESMRWCIAGATRLDASCSAKSKAPSKFIGFLLIATIIIGFIALSGMVAVNADTGELGSIGIAQAALIVDAMFLHVLAWEFIFLHLIRRRFGTQIVMDPRHTPSPS